jgi:hypothetical protein
MKLYHRIGRLGWGLAIAPIYRLRLLDHQVQEHLHEPGRLRKVLIVGPSHFPAEDGNELVFKLY